MADRKSALVGCREGPWVCIYGMHKPVLRITGDVGVKVQYNGDDWLPEILNTGDHKLQEGTYVRLFVVKGDPKDALCLILTSKAAATVEV